MSSTSTNSSETKSVRRGILPLSADPIHYGHLDLIARAAQRCDELIVLVSENDQKCGSYLFTSEERVAFVERAVALRGIPRVTVRFSRNLLVDEMSKLGCSVIFRGIRNAQDREMEERQMRYHTMIQPGVIDEVVYLESSDEWCEVSSSMVKAFARHDLEVSRWTPVFVQSALEERICKRWSIGITGEIASGKTWVSGKLTLLLEQRGYEATSISIDQLVRDAYVEDSPGAQLLRDGLARLCGDEVLSEDRRSVNRPLLAQRLFAETTSGQTRQAVHALTAPHVARLHRQALHGTKGIVLLEWAQLAEMEMGSRVNHRSIVVESDERAQLAETRGIDAVQLKQLSAIQWSAERKTESLAAAARQAGGGMVLRYRNHRASAEESERTIGALADEILRHVPSFCRKAQGGGA